MYLDKSSIKRLGIYYVYDEDGVIDDYMVHLLKSLRRKIDKILVICAGGLTDEGRAKLINVSDEIISSKYVDSDIFAYKEGIEYIGWDNLKCYDEIVMFNYTIMGPVNSFDEMFDYMDKQDLDFWGITKHYKTNLDPNADLEYAYTTDYIKSHFICIRQSMLKDISFFEYWNNCSEQNSFIGEISKYEIIFIKKFYDMGFKWDVYVDTDDIKSMNSYPLMYMPIELVKNRKCPIFERKMFFQDHADILINTSGNTTRDFHDYIEVSAKYDTNMIWDNILRTCNQEDIVRCLNLRYILSSSVYNEKKVEKIIKEKKIALVMHLYFEDLIEDMCLYASYMPINADIYITTNSEDKKKRIKQIFNNRLNNNLIDVRVIENRGRDVSSILIGVKDIVYNYDYICFAHDKKTTQLKPGTVGSGFASKCFENTLRNKMFVNNVLCLFEDNERLGILSPPGPNHADYFGGYGNEWGPNFKETESLAKKLGINVSIDKNKMPIAPFGTLFWFRPIALKNILDYRWNYDDFPPEPNNIDGTVLHAIERLYPFAAQEMGYYPAILMSDYSAGIECTNLDYYARTFNNKVSEVIGRNYHFALINQLDECKRQLREREDLLVKNAELINERFLLLEENNTIKGEKFEMELKTLETIKYIDELQKQATLKYQLKKTIKKILRI